MRNAFFIPMVLLALVHAARAEPTINVGDHTLLPNTAGQIVSILVSGGDAVQGLNLLVQSGDGGSALGGVDGSAPKIQDISITTGTIFDGNNTGRVFDDGPTDQLWQIHTTTASGTVAANGVLAVLTVDTTGFTSGSFPLLLGNIGGDPDANTDFAGIPATIINGTINVPEPGTTTALVGVLFLMRRHYRECAHVRSIESLSGSVRRITAGCYSVAQ